MSGERHAVAQFRARGKEHQHVERHIAGPDELAAIEVGVDLGECGVDRATGIVLADGRTQRNPRVVENLEALRLASGVEKTGALPFVEAQADRLAADAQCVGNLALTDGAREAHMASLCDTDIVGGVEEPVGECNVAIAQHVGRPDVERRDQALHRKTDQPATDGLGFGNDRRQKRIGNPVKFAGDDCPRGRTPDDLALDQTGSHELELAEGITGDDVLGVRLQAVIVGGQHQLDDAARADCGRIGGKREEDGLGRIAGLIDQFAGSRLSSGARLLRDALEGGRISAAKQPCRLQYTCNVFSIHTFTKPAIRPAQSPSTALKLAFFCLLPLVILRRVFSPADEVRHIWIGRSRSNR